MYAKIEIRGKIEVCTGMHIGGSSAFAAIGAVDSPVIKDVRTGNPIIPGSSLKGKMRTLLAKKYNQKKVASSPDNDDECLLRLFGTSKKDAKGCIKKSRVIFSDMIMSNAEELRDKGIRSLTEVKFENSIDRITAVANPRQIERVIRGAQFDLNIIYELDNEEEAIEDLAILADGMKLLGYDYLGGSGSRGYGKIKFNNLETECVVGEVSDDTLDKIDEIFRNV